MQLMGVATLNWILTKLKIIYRLCRNLLQLFYFSKPKVNFIDRFLVYLTTRYIVSIEARISVISFISPCHTFFVQNHYSGDVKPRIRHEICHFIFHKALFPLSSASSTELLLMFSNHLRKIARIFSCGKRRISIKQIIRNHIVFFYFRFIIHWQMGLPHHNILSVIFSLLLLLHRASLNFYYATRFCKWREKKASERRAEQYKKEKSNGVLKDEEEKNIEWTENGGNGAGDSALSDALCTLSD